MTESRGELELRRLIMNALEGARSDAGTVTREQPSSVGLGFETRRVIDQSRGIWNPRDLEATLSVLSTPLGALRRRGARGVSVPIRLSRRID